MSAATALPIPRAVKQHRHKLASLHQAKAQGLPWHSCDDPAHLGFVRGRMLDLLHERVHPSAFHDPSHGEESPYDPMRGVKFGYRDRSELCYTGNSHEGTQNMRCFVDAETDDVFVKCFSSKCAPHAPLRIGALYEDPDVWAATALTVAMPYLKTQERKVPPPTPASEPADASVPAAAAAAAAEDPDAVLFGDLLSEWASGEFRALGIKSAMGTGKSTLLNEVLRQHFVGRTVLVVTYRQTLAYEVGRKLQPLGFANYLEEAGSLHDRAKYPRVICQIESMGRLGTDAFVTPSFDLIVIDEVESVLRHLTSPTVRSPQAMIRCFTRMLRNAACGLLTMDAYWGAATYDFLAKVGMSQRVVINTHLPPQRVFEFTDFEAEWQEGVRSDLVDHGRNVVVVSLSTEAISRLISFLVEKRAVDRSDILVHTSKSDDRVKRKLRNVDALWRRYRVVAYSPTVEAGVDFSTPHFGAMHVFCCRKSTTPLGLVQMTGRVRVLESNVVRCCAPAGMLQEQPGHRRFTAQEGRIYVRWMLTELQRLPVVPTDVQLDDDASAGVTVDLPAEDAMLEVFAHNEVAAVNSSLRFFAELTDLLTTSGHVVRLTRSTVERRALSEEERAPSYKRERLLGAADVKSDAELAALKRSIEGNDATEDQKWMYARHQYKQCWGIDRLDEAFLDKHGTEPNANKVRQLVRVLFTALHEVPDIAPSQSRALLRAPHVAQLLEALGFKSPFDVDHVIRTQLVELYEKKLRNLELFAKYADVARLFRVDSRPPKAWDNNTISRAIGMVLRSVGLELTYKRPPRTRKNGVKVAEGAGTYRMDAESVGEMAELLKLRLRRVPTRYRVPDNAHAAQFLEGLQYERYGRLVSPDAYGAAAVFMFVDDEEDTVQA